MLNILKKRKKKRVLIKAKVPCLYELINHGIEYTYKPGFDNSSKGKKYWKNFGKWIKDIKNYEIVILGENYYNFDVSRYIKKINPKCKVIVYFWNKLVFDSYFDILDDHNVDEFYTFDEEEAQKYNFKFNTTYYSKKVSLPNNKIETDVIFCGRSKDREDKILKIENRLNKNNISTDFRIITDEKDYIEYNLYLEMVSKSKALLDYNAYNQKGLSLRVMEALFFEKKLITNNKNIKKCKFYNKNNIFIIGVDKWCNIDSFLKSKYKKIDNDIIDYYDFEQWIMRFK